MIQIMIVLGILGWLLLLFVVTWALSSPKRDDDRRPTTREIERFFRGS